MLRLAALSAVLIIAGCAGTKPKAGSSASVSSPAVGAGTAASAASSAGSTAAALREVSLPGGLKYVDLKVGDGAIAESGMIAAVHYTGRLLDGTKVDSSVDKGQPLKFRIGGGQVIRGWDEGIRGMRVGGSRKLTVPPDMAYGAAGAGDVIPPNSTLVFDIELLDLR